LSRQNAMLGLCLALCLCIAPNIAYAGPVYDRVASTGVVRLGVPYNLVPQGFLQNGQWLGFEVDMAAELAKHLKAKPELVRVNDKTWRSLLAQGLLDGAFCRIRHTRTVEKEFDLSEAYFYDAQQVLVVKGSLRSAQDLKGRKLAAIQGTTSEKLAMSLLKALKDDQAEAQVVSYPDAASCFLALTKGKVAGWIDWGLTLLEYASRNQGKFDLIDVSDTPQGIAMAIPQDDSAWRDAVNFALQDMALDGSLDKIYEKWFGAQTPYAFPKKRTMEIWPE
jgi:polar amino acid transport system substrate-binding protein